ncbi:MAG: hypothetical protein AB7P01_05435 [Bacteroidia bacterium]
MKPEKKLELLEKFSKKLPKDLSVEEFKGLCLMETTDEEDIKNIGRFNGLKIKAEIQKGYTSYKLRTLQKYICPVCIVKYDIKKICFEKFITEEKEREKNRKKWEKENRKEKRAYWLEENKKLVKEKKADKVGEYYNSPTHKLVFKAIESNYNEDENLKSELKVMKLEDFFEHWYWLAVKVFMIRVKRHKCACGSYKNVNVYHTNYNNRGAEHLHWETDLVVLCELHKPDLIIKHQP